MKCNAVDMGIKIRHVLAREEEYIHISLYQVSRLDTNDEKEQIYLRTRTLRHNDRGGVSCVPSQCPQWERREARHDRKRELGETVVQTNGPIPANS